MAAESHHHDQPMGLLLASRVGYHLPAPLPVQESQLLGVVREKSRPLANSDDSGAHLFTGNVAVE